MEEPVIKPMIDMPHIAGLVQSMVRKALDAFVNRDADLARSVLASDDAVDSLRSACYHELVSFMEKDPQNIRQALDLLAVTRNLERIRGSFHKHRRRCFIPCERVSMCATAPK